MASSAMGCHTLGTASGERCCAGLQLYTLDAGLASPSSAPASGVLTLQGSHLLASKFPCLQLSASLCPCSDFLTHVAELGRAQAGANLIRMDVPPPMEIQAVRELLTLHGRALTTENCRAHVAAQVRM